ncbi:hypothetical protein ACFZBU_39965 [Embleya sp. NPDC008237]|uniref:hypothetical protein n=1 Tax=Embleya sp. NPDC008237 TaxID=3363978 RepID=UPI0036ED7DC0
MPEPLGRTDSTNGYALRYEWRRSLHLLTVAASDASASNVSDSDAFESDRRRVWAEGLDETGDVPVVVVSGERGSGKSVALEQEQTRLDGARLPNAYVHLGRDVFAFVQWSWR